jgi:PAS domain S-box-containing protein
MTTERERFLEALLESAVDYAIIALDLDGLVTSWNAGATRLLGWEEAEMVGHPASNFFTIADRRAGVPQAEMQAALQQGRGSDERWHLRKDGTTFWANGEMMPLRDEAGDVQGFIKILRDRTAQRLAAEAQHDDAAFLRSVLAASGDCIKVLDLDGRLTFMNEGGKRVMEVDDFDAITGHRWQHFWHGAHRAEAEAAIAAAKAGGIGHFQAFAPTMKGNVKWWDVQVTAIPDAQGQAGKLLAVSRDQTERRRAEEQLEQRVAELHESERRVRELNETLERRVEERTRERDRVEEALRQSQKMDALGQLTGGIAHDFNNLLTGIIGSLDIVRRRMGDGRSADIPRFMDAASASAQRAAALTHRLLAFARRQSLDTRPSDVNALVLGMEDLLHRTLGEQVSLRTELAEALWPALADDNQLENAILNLAINARDAMPEGGRLTIETANARLDAAYAAAVEDVAAGDYVMIAVSDTGCGMPPDIVGKAFDPFFTTKPIGEGTGLGLSMIYGFVKQSAGHVRIYSEVGQGTTIKLFLRRAAELNAVAEEELEVPLGQGETVLVVEDDEAVRLIVTSVLDELGYRHLEAPDGMKALPILQSGERIDLLVTDVGLPKINGRQLAEMARAARPGLKVLFVTGYAEKAAVRHGFLEPGMAMLMKPFALDALATKVREMIEG